jgi:hypothetical protein
VHTARVFSCSEFILLSSTTSTAGCQSSLQSSSFDFNGERGVYINHYMWVRGGALAVGDSSMSCCHLLLLFTTIHIGFPVHVYGQGRDSYSAAATGSSRVQRSSSSSVNSAQYYSVLQ